MASFNDGEEARAAAAQAAFLESYRMTKILTLTGSFVGGSIGWWIGAFVGTMTAFMLSIVGSGAGVYIGRRIATEFEF